MTTQLTVWDETTGGTRTGEFTLELPSEQISVRELIRSRIYQEVKDFNRHRPNVYSGLVQPSGAELALNGAEARKTKLVDWQKQYEAAIDAFERCQLLVLVDGRQAQRLDDQIELQSDPQITFLKLVPLTGG